MSQTSLSIRVDGSIGEMILNNPQKRNALPQSGWQEIPFALAKLVGKGARTIIVRGENTDFCAGADISEFDTVRKNAQTARVYEASNVAAFDALRTCPVPTVAMIRGYCLGGGFGLAAACDLRIAMPDARFAVPAARLGLGYPVDAIADIVEAVGTQNAKRLLFTGRIFSSDEMFAMGFLMEIVHPEKIADQTREIAARICDLAPLTHRATKAAILALRTGEWQEARKLSDATFVSTDYVEGRDAFREKRRAVFRGT